MKLGILTQPLHDNYGGIIQNWALQQVLKSMGHKPVMINRYHFRKVTFKLFLIRNLSFFKLLLMKIVGRKRGIHLMSPFNPNYSPNSLLNFDRDFIKKIDKTKVCYTDKELRKEIKKGNFDAFVVGSDQVWRENYSPRIETYFLDFLSEDDHRPRVAYAASFGINKGYIRLDKMVMLRNLLNRFDAVSVREQDGIRIVQEDFGRQQVEQTLDPTLLLNVDEYRKEMRKDDVVRGDSYLSAYVLDLDRAKDRIVIDIATRLGLSIKKMSMVENAGYSRPTISQWLANIDGSSFVVTDSFHGCVFSIIFGKPFVCIANRERGYERFTSLLSSLDLTHRLIEGEDDYFSKAASLLEPIPYDKIKIRLEEFKRNSLKFLSDALA